MGRYRNSVFKFFLASFGFLGFAFSTFAGDGPQNSARISLKRLDNEVLEITLQADKKLFSNPSEVYQLFEIRTKNQVCDVTPPLMIANADTLSAVAQIKCQQTLNLINISLKSIETLTTGFSLGVQTPFDHFALSKEIPSRETQLSAFRLFFTEGLTLGFQKNNLIGKPYAFSFGGLAMFPWGIWWILVILGWGVSAAKTRDKILALALAAPVSGIICYVLLSTESSLKWITAPKLDSLFLVLAFSLSVSGFFKQSRPISLFSVFLGVVLILVSGFDLAIILRWLEGNTMISLPEAVVAFFSGLWITTLVFGALMVYRKIGFLNHPNAVLGARLFILGLSLYTFLSLTFQLL